MSIALRTLPYKKKRHTPTPNVSNERYTEKKKAGKNFRFIRFYEVTRTIDMKMDSLLEHKNIFVQNIYKFCVGNSTVVMRILEILV